jgi:hypothetical protein
MLSQIEGVIEISPRLESCIIWGRHAGLYSGEIREGSRLEGTRLLRSFGNGKNVPPILFKIMTICRKDHPGMAGLGTEEQSPVSRSDSTRCSWTLHEMLEINVDVPSLFPQGIP